MTWNYEDNTLDRLLPFLVALCPVLSVDLILGTVAMFLPWDLEWTNMSRKAELNMQRTESRALPYHYSSSPISRSLVWKVINTLLVSAKMNWESLLCLPCDIKCLTATNIVKFRVIWKNTEWRCYGIVLRSNIYFSI